MVIPQTSASWWRLKKSMNIDILSLEEEKSKIWSILETITDPEVPVLTIMDLGIVRNVILNSPLGDGGIEVIITPTYSGCPAMDMISMNIKMELLANGFKNSRVTLVLSPAWTTDWMSEEGKRKLKEYGIAPPNAKQQFCKEEMFNEEAVQCPHCNSHHTQLISQFGSTACKSMYRCLDCKETFDYFKCH